MEWIIPLTAIAAGTVQGLTGFGSAITMMMVLPMFYAMPQAAGVSSATIITLNALLVFTYRKHIRIKKVLPPGLLSLMFSTIAIHFSALAGQVFLKKLFGGFLILLCLYYLFAQKGESKRLSAGVSVAFIVASGICDGLFSIGGPLMVLYFLGASDTTEEYLGNIQGYFLMSTVYNTLFRIARGIVTAELLPMILCGGAGMLVGGLIANRLVKRINPAHIRKLIYVMIGVSGVIYILQ